MVQEGGQEPFISVIIPNRNGMQSIAKCLAAVCSSHYPRYEVIVADDCSDDGSRAVIEAYPVQLVRLPARGGASAARNAGARHARGDILFFIDADCVVRPETLAVAARCRAQHPEAVVGGTYTPVPHDTGFYSMFQSVFVHYSEAKRAEPDYVATHALLIGKELFLTSGGFDERFLPILEDVEFSHRLRRRGVPLLMCPGLLVEHIFGFTLSGSLRNAFRKARYWSIYSLANRDLLTDSGTASLELKANSLAWALSLVLLALGVTAGSGYALLALLAVCGANLAINRGFASALFRTGGRAFGLKALLYYTALYPLAVVAGGLTGLLWRR
ncbi:MAG: glycosyltransferase [Nitrospirota bacterium]|jgi:GT2 family glycosyltransferase